MALIRLTSVVCTTLAAAALAAACSDGAEIVSPSCTITTPTPTLQLTFGAAATVSATATCQNVSTVALRWSSSAPDVFTIDSLTGAIRPVTAGNADLIVTVAGVPGAALHVPVAVLPNPACATAGLFVNPTNLALNVGARATLRATFDPSCGITDTRVTFASSDTAAVGVDSAGTALGRIVGRQATITVTSRANPALHAFTLVTVLPPPNGIGLTVSPSQVVVAPFDTARIHAQVALAPGTPAGTSSAVTFRSADSCAARVDSTGLVTTLGYGALTSITVASAAYPSVAQIVAVRAPDPPPAPSAGFRSITTDGTTPVDPTNVRGTIRVDVFLDRYAFPTSGRVDLWLAGRLATSATYAVPVPGTPRASVPLTLDTRAFANGAQTLEARVYTDGGGYRGCPGPSAGLLATTARTVVLANP